MDFADAPLMVLCTRCGDAVAIDERCPTCGESHPIAAAAHHEPAIDDALLDRVGEALAAQAALAQRTAAARMARTGELRAQQLVLRGRLRTQRVLLRRSRRAARDATPRVANALDRVERALQQAQPEGLVGHGWRLRVRLPRDDSCAAVARRLVRDYVSDELEPAASDGVLLVASELATNAYVHGEGTITLGVERRADRIRVDVADEGCPARIGIGLRGDYAVGGRGLALIEQIALRWGVVPGTAHVWAELPLV